MGLASAFTAAAGRPAWVLVCPSDEAVIRRVTSQVLNAESLDTFSESETVAHVRRDGAISEQVRKVQAEAVLARVTEGRVADAEERKRTYGTPHDHHHHHSQ